MPISLQVFKTRRKQKQRKAQWNDALTGELFSARFWHPLASQALIEPRALAYQNVNHTTWLQTASSKAVLRIRYHTYCVSQALRTLQPLFATNVENTHLTYQGQLTKALSSEHLWV